ncbi:MAG: isoleucine--tRNA ligase [Parachlamydiales bacterium]|nr:isoleucine--tRNA ligase [Parachlamydiales bacterium]
MFEEIGNDPFPKKEEKILEFWEKQQIFKKSLSNRKSSPFFAFYDGPPFATGLPHYGHLLAGTIKDVVPRYKTMKGYLVPRRFGWDCHGLPVEHEVEKQHGLSGAKSIEDWGIAKFNETCRSIVLRYTEEWKKTVTRMGRWVDFELTYKTMDKPFMESVWWIFSQLWEKNLVYLGHKVMPYSAKLGTPLSNFEAGENYKDVDDPALTVSFKLKDTNASLLIWTTTPWTLISNLAIAVGPTIQYVRVRRKQDNEEFILAKERLSATFAEEDIDVIQEMTGLDLKGMHYVPAFDYFKDHENAFQVIADDFVTIEDGTGLVHCAPAFGESDFFACQKAKISLVCPVDDNGRFTQEIPEYTGQFVKDADKDIAQRLKKAGKLFKQATIRHRYPFCYRSDTPLIYKAVETWFVAVEKIKDQLIAANQKVHWMPDHLKQGRFGNWLAGARDWAISRNRYWGTPIPLWIGQNGDRKVISNIAELEKLTGKKIDDIHRHFIDDLTFEFEGQTYKRITEVFDCWFESGSMPYAQNHYPFENANMAFPADFIAEGIDQTRGWFYTLMVISTALKNEPAFKNVIVNGIILAEDGAKMSKRLKNYPEPEIVINKYGSDAIRLFLLNSPAVKAEDLRFSERGVELVMRQALIPLWNAYSFFITYARIYNWTPKSSLTKPKAVIDQWMLSRLQQLILDVEKGMDNYDLSAAVGPFVAFIDQLTNWYIRLSRPRFWSDIESQDRQEAFETLYYVLLTLSQVTAPFIPFLSETLYQNLRAQNMPESVHLCDYPKADNGLLDAHLEKVMGMVQESVSLGHMLRKENRLKVRQPLQRCFIISSSQSDLDAIKEHQDLILDELNVKAVELHNDESQFVSYVAKANFRVLGKKVGKWMPQVQKAIQALQKDDLQKLSSGASIDIKVDTETFSINSDDVQVERQVKEGVIAAHSNACGITIALDTVLTQDLIVEGLARELKNKINTMRREMGLAVTDRIRIHLQASDKVIEAYKHHQKFIDSEVLAVEVILGPCDGVVLDLNGEEARMTIEIASVV